MARERGCHVPEKAKGPTRPEHLRCAGLRLALRTLNLVKQIMASPKVKPLGPFRWVHLRLTRMHADVAGGATGGVSLQERALFAFTCREPPGCSHLEIRNPRAPSGGWRLDLPC